MTGAERRERPERSPHAVGGPGSAAGLIGAAAAVGVRLEARPGGRLWADKPGLLPAALRDSLAAHRPAVVARLAEWQHAEAAPDDAPPPDAANRPRTRAAGGTHPNLPGVPPEWREGVRLLASKPAPPTIPPRRWAALQTTAGRLLHLHGAELHAARWDTIALFGLHPDAPATYPAGWGLAWLLGEHGEVLDVAPDVVGMRREPRGWRMVCVRRCGPPPPNIVPAWALD